MLSVVLPCLLHICSYGKFNKIFIRKNNSVAFQLTNVVEDRFGRYLVIQCEILSLRLNNCSLFPSLADLPGNFIIGGDFNCTL